METGSQAKVSIKKSTVYEEVTLDFRGYGGMIQTKKPAGRGVRTTQ